MRGIYTLFNSDQDDGLLNELIDHDDIEFYELVDVPRPPDPAADAAYLDMLDYLGDATERAEAGGTCVSLSRLGWELVVAKWQEGRVL